MAPRVERALETLVIAWSMAEIAPAEAALPRLVKLIELRLNAIWLPEPASAPTCSVNVPERTCRPLNWVLPAMRVSSAVS